MDSKQIRILEKFRAETAFMTDNAADFPRETPGDRTAQRLTGTVALIETLAGQQTSLAVRQNLGVKTAALERLVELMKKINGAAVALADEIEGIERRFRLPRRRTQERWLAAARAFYTDTADFEGAMEPYDLGPGFRERLAALTDALELAIGALDSAEARKGGATGGLVEAFREAGRHSRKLDAIVRNKYAADAGKLAAWRIASHTEAAPQRRKAAKK
ncbi:MAG: hypothetical protein JSS81_11145 [Acidobacteria bacterium]|nr:hypothetical protein [Acidobacteriota bacterium]